jgi:bifunctional UDP-N-acetylglucosamine pyrophosphorylase/glucosamine-1-phosphate N-acetyltransferase
MMATLDVVVLAAGEGKRMRSRTQKILHPLAGRPLIAYPVALGRALGGRITLVLGRQGEAVRQAVGESPDLQFAEQKEPRGTGHALLQARPLIGADSGTLLVLPGDVPLLSVETLRALLDHHEATRAAATLLTAVVEDPRGYGRLLRDREKVVAIVEERDAFPEQRKIREIGTSIYCFHSRLLWPALEQVTDRNDQGEYYLTDVIGILSRQGHRVEAYTTEDPAECLGVNDRKQLAHLAGLVRQKILDHLMVEGVTIIDPVTTYIDADVRIGQDTVIYPGVALEGKTVIGEGCVIGPGCQISGSRLGDRVILKAYCVISDSRIEEGATVGPFAHLRPLSVVGPSAKVGNFVELKKSTIGKRSKVPHLSYVGDATIGEDVNIGAGTITCNYDGVVKHETKIGDQAFIGTNSSLVAPLTIGAGAYVGAGSTITEDVPPGALAVGRGKQVIKEGWAARRKSLKKPSKPEKSD